MDNKNVSKIFSLIIPFSILLIAMSIGYFLVIYLPQKELRQVELQKMEIQAKEQKEERAKAEMLQVKIEAKTSLDNCLADSFDNYTETWNNQCKFLGLINSECVVRLDSSLENFNKYKNEYRSGIADNTVKTLDDYSNAMKEYLSANKQCSCRLPTITADRYEADLQGSKNDCYKRYPQP